MLLVLATLLAWSVPGGAQICVTNDSNLPKIRAYYTCDGSLFGCSKAQALVVGKETCWMASTGKMDLLKVKNNKCGTMLMTEDTAKITIRNNGEDIVCDIVTAKDEAAAKLVKAEEAVDPLTGDPILDEGVALKNDVLVIHYWRSDENYEEWGINIWGEAVVNPTDEAEPLLFQEKNEFGMSLGFQVTPNAKSSQVRFYIHNGKDQDIGHNREFPLHAGKEFWLLQDDPTVYSSKEAALAAKEFMQELDDF